MKIKLLLTILLLAEIITNAQNAEKRIFKESTYQFRKRLNLQPTMSLTKAGNLVIQPHYLPWQNLKVR